MEARLNPEYPPGSTSLNPDEIAGLLHNITTQKELNELEYVNILLGVKSARKSRRMRKELLTYDGLVTLHKLMFGEVWRWAGVLRISQKNIGIPASQVAAQMVILCDDVRYWLANNSYSLDEIAVRLSHRLAYIHPFPNGNGRLSRIAADLLLEFNKRPMFSWGSIDLTNESETRKDYIAALRLADQHDISALLRFARS
jgi:Fic-DOC domain mobile mystery protein B